MNVNNLDVIFKKRDVARISERIEVITSFVTSLEKKTFMKMCHEFYRVENRRIYDRLCNKNERPVNLIVLDES